MENLDLIRRTLEKTVATREKKIKLKLDPDGPSLSEKMYQLQQFTISKNKEIRFVVLDGSISHIVCYTDIERLDYFDNGSCLKVWVETNASSSRFYLYYNDCET